MESSDTVKLFVGGLPKEAKEETLRDHFKQFGEVEESLVIRERNTKCGRGFGFVTFTDSSMADEALRFGDEHGHLILGKKVEVKRALPRVDMKERSNSNGINKIFVGGLPDDLTDDEFKTYFEDFGTVTDAVVMYDKYTGRRRGFGFITFDSQDAAENVLKQNTYELKNKKVEVKRAQPKDLNDKYINIYHANNTYLGYGGSSYNSHIPVFNFHNYPPFPMVQNYGSWGPTFYAPGWGSPYTVHHMEYSSMYHGNSNGENDRGKVATNAKLQDYSYHRNSNGDNDRGKVAINARCDVFCFENSAADDPSSLKSSVAELQIGEIEIDDSISSKSSILELQMGVIDDSLSLENTTTEIQDGAGADGSCPNHIVDEA